MNPQPSRLEVIQEESPQVSDAFHGHIDSLRVARGLNGKTKQLAYIVLRASLRNARAIYHHVPMAKSAAASREEVKYAILITLTTWTSGFPLALELYIRY